MTRTAFDELVRHAPGATSDIDNLFPDPSAQPPKRRFRRPAILVAAVATVTATVLVVPMMLPGGTASAAALDNLSAAAGRQPERAPDGIFHEVVVERQKGMADRTLESWTLADGTTWRRDTTANGSMEYWKFPPGPTRTSPATVAALPTDPVALDAVVRKQVSGSVSTDEAVFRFYGDALRLGYVPPAVRRAMLMATKRLPHITTERAATIDGIGCLKVTYYEPLRLFLGRFYCFNEATASIVEEGQNMYLSNDFRSTVTVSEYVSAVPTVVTTQAVTEQSVKTTPETSPTATPS